VQYSALLAVINSTLVEKFIQSVSRPQRGGYYRYQTRLMAQIPIPIKGMAHVRGHFQGPSNAASDLYLRGSYGALLSTLPRHPLCQGERAFHDLLAYLAQQMIDLHKQKQAEIKRFLSWLEGQLGAHIEDLSGKTILCNYLGDYQKGEGELPFDEFVHRLGQNRSKIRANLSDPALVHRLRGEYPASLGALLPIKQRLKETDWLIDQIVYKLYGLTEEEIAIVEGRV